jgi:hypothetical protein
MFDHAAASPCWRIKRYLACDFEECVRFTTWRSTSTCAPDKNA